MNYEKFKRNERLEGIFNRAATGYDTIGPNYFSYYGKRLVEHAKINPGAILLDIACGKGASLFPAISKIGENGRVIGIDFSQEMVRETQLLICEQRLYNARLFQMDAELLNFADNSFDYILCGLSAAFFSDSLRAIDEMYRVLKNDCKLGLSTWQKKEKQGILDKVYSKLFPENQNRNLNNINGRPDFGSVDGIEKILKNAGLKNIEIFTEKKTFYYKNEEEWWNEQWTNATRGLFEHVESIGSDAINTFKEAVLFELMEYKDKYGIRFDAEVIFSFGYK